MRIVVTAGYNKSKAAIALCELVRRSGHEVVGILLISPYSLARVRALIRQRGKDGLKQAVGKLLPGRGRDDDPGALARYFESLGIASRTLSQWAKLNAVRCVVTGNINAGKSVDFVTDSDVDLLIYAGGGIVRKPLIDAAKRAIINPHCGPLPEVRGMNAIEWALLLGYPLDVTVHFIDEGIDTGAIVSRVPAACRNDMSIGELRDHAVISGITEIHRLLSSHRDAEPLPCVDPTDAVPGRQCYVMAPALQELAALRLRRQGSSE